MRDPAGAPVPDGSRRGETRVAGPGVTRGYRRRPEPTARRFAPGPDGARTRCSGDLAVRLPSGELEVLGRVDDQTTVRGFRTEPFGIEACLAGHPAVAAAAAVVRARDHGDGDVCLVAHMQPVRLADVPDADAAALTRTPPP